jgi:PAS domain S-box-containing protein
MKISVENRIRLGFGIGLLFLLLIGAVAYWSASWSVGAFRAVESTEHVLDLLRSTLTAMVDVETGTRGFLITGKEPFLEPFESGKKQVSQSLEELRTAITNDSEQSAKLVELEPLLTQKIAVSTDSISLRQSGENRLVATEAGLMEGKQVMDAIREVIASMEAVEQKRLAQRSEDATSTFHTTMVVVSVSTVLAIVLAGFASIMAHRDFNRRRKAEEERDRFFLLTRDLVCFAGFDGYFKSVNPAWERVLGYPSGELLAKPFVEFVHPDDRAETIRQAEKLTQGEEVIQFENRYQAKDGSYRWFSWNARASISEKVIYATARDFTEQIQSRQQIAYLNEDLSQHAAELEEANKELEAFSYSVSHDLRAPLRHIDGFVSSLRKKAGPVLDETSRRYMNIISESARHMGNLIDDLLVFSRMGRTEMHRSNVDLPAMVKEVIADFEPEMQRRKITWKTGKLPCIRGDAAMLRQVFVNLLQNAVKYTRTREEAEIEIGSTETGDELVVFVRDNGVGFEMDYAHKLFGVFQRLHRADEFEGTGIGLANVRRIVQRHGGRTWAEGKVDGGATLYFSLPKHRNEP